MFRVRTNKQKENDMNYTTEDQQRLLLTMAFAELKNDENFLEDARKLAIMKSCKCEFKYLFDIKGYAQEIVVESFDKRCATVNLSDDLSDAWYDMEIEERLEIIFGADFGYLVLSGQCPCTKPAE